MTIRACSSTFVGDCTTLHGSNFRESRAQGASTVAAPGSYDPSHEAVRLTASQPWSMPKSARLNYVSRQERHWLSPRQGPGPGDYRPLLNYDSTFGKG